MASVAGESTQAYLLGNSCTLKRVVTMKKEIKKRRQKKKKVSRTKKIYKSSLQRVIFYYAFFIALSIAVVDATFIAGLLHCHPNTVNSYTH